MSVLLRGGRPVIMDNSHAATNYSSVGSSHTKRLADDLIETARSANQCEAALAELRQFSVSEEAVMALRQHADAHPVAGCEAMALGARLLFKEQLKAYLDQELEVEAADMIERHKGTPEAEIIQHAMNAVGEYATNEDLAQCSTFFAEYADRAESDEKFPHFRLLRLIADARLTQARAMAAPEHADALDPLAREFRTLAAGRQSSIVLRRLRARYRL